MFVLWMAGHSGADVVVFPVWLQTTWGRTPTTRHGSTNTQLQSTWKNGASGGSRVGRYQVGVTFALCC